MLKSKKNLKIVWLVLFLALLLRCTNTLIHYDYRKRHKIQLFKARGV